MLMIFFYSTILSLGLHFLCCFHTKASSLMGIEVETSAIKTKTPLLAGEIRFDFKKEDQGFPLFCLEQDTPDGNYKDNREYEEYNKNLEIKTIGGHDHQQINEITSAIESLLTKLYEDASENPQAISTEYLKAILNDSYDVSYGGKTKPDFSIKSKDPSEEEPDPIIRLQITYQLPLSDVCRVFQHLAELGHRDIEPFLNDLNPNIPFRKVNFEKMKNAYKDRNFTEEEAEKKVNNLKINNAVGQYFKEKIAQEFTNLRQNNVKGFIQLFLFYWYTLFNNKEPTGNERGLKQISGYYVSTSFLTTL